MNTRNRLTTACALGALALPALAQDNPAPATLPDSRLHFSAGVDVTTAYFSVAFCRKTTG